MIRGNLLKARENQNLVVYRTNWLLWKNSLSVVPIGIVENLKTVKTIKFSPWPCKYSLSSVVHVIAEIDIVPDVSHYNIKSI